MAVDDAPRQLTCDVVERNSLAVSFNQLRLATTELASADAAELERIGKALADRLTYLMEPIARSKSTPRPASCSFAATRRSATMTAAATTS